MSALADGLKIIENLPDKGSITNKILLELLVKSKKQNNDSAEDKLSCPADENEKEKWLKKVISRDEAIITLTLAATASTSSNPTGSNEIVRDNRKTLHIVHFNDVYNLGTAPQSDGLPCGGVTRFATVLKELRDDLRKIGHRPLVLFSGDFVGVR